MSLIEKVHSIEEVIPDKKELPAINVKVCGEDVLAVNPGCSWELDRVFVDYMIEKPHEVFIAVFKRKIEE